MRILSGIFGLVILTFVLCFALSNGQQVGVGLWPFTGALQVPLYLVVLAPLLLGLAIGGFWGWIGGVPYRLRARRLNKELGALNDRIGELQKTATIQSVQIEPKRPIWKRRS